MKASIFGIALRLAPVALAAVLAGCSSMPTPETAISDVAAFHSPAEARVLATGERLRLVAFDAEGLSGNYVIAADGRIDLGRFGRLDAAGLTPAQLEEAIAERLAEAGHAEARVSVMPEAG